jgi:molybdenum cofactor cytidylyltransferase
MNFILLAAGRGQRMGGNKALMLFKGETWVQIQIRQIEAASFDQILIVTNPESAEAVEEITMRHRNVQVSVNEQPDRGPFSSLQIALNESVDKVVFVNPMDVPLKGTTLIELKKAWQKSENLEALIPSFQNRRGHPVVLSPTLQEKIRALEVQNPDSRLDFVLRNLADSKKQILELNDEFIPLNINNPEDLENLTNPI